MALSTISPLAFTTIAVAQACKPSLPDFTYLREKSFDALELKRYAPEGDDTCAAAIARALSDSVLDKPSRKAARRARASLPRIVVTPPDEDVPSQSYIQERAHISLNLNFGVVSDPLPVPALGESTPDRLKLLRKRQAQGSWRLNCTESFFYPEAYKTWIKPRQRRKRRARMRRGPMDVRGGALGWLTQAADWIITTSQVYMVNP